MVDFFEPKPSALLRQFFYIFDTDLNVQDGIELRCAGLCIFVCAGNVGAEEALMLMKEKQRLLKRLVAHGEVIGDRIVEIRPILHEHLPSRLNYPLRKLQKLRK